MKNKTLNFKLLALIMSVVMLFSSISLVTFAADATVSAPADTVDPDVSYAIEFLASIGIIYTAPNGTYNFPANEQLSRGEFASLLYNMLNLSPVTTSEAVFEDVPISHSFFKEITTLAKLGILVGDGVTNFNPDDLVDYSQAVKGIVSVLGYEEMSQVKGGYPVGYFLVASELGFLPKHASNDSTITRGEVALMIANAADVDISVAMPFGAGTRYEVLEGRNYLSYYHDYLKVEGVLTATDAFDFDSDVTPKKGTVKIDGVKFDLDNAAINPYDMIGFDVVGYYEDMGVGLNGRLISLRAVKKIDTSLVIDGENIVGFNESTHELSYYRDGSANVSRVDIAPSARVIYNGCYVPSYTVQMLTDVNGTVELIETGVKGYDLIKIKNWSTYVVSSVDVANGKIYNLYNPTDIISVDETDPDLRVSIKQDGKAISVSNIAPWDVIECAVSVNKKVVEIELYRKVVSGTVTSITTDSDDTFVTIDGTEYEVLSDNAAEFKTKFAIGSSATFHLGKDDIVVGWSALKASADYSLGLFIKAGNNPEDIDGSILVSIFTTNNQVATYGVASNLKINGQKVTVSEAKAKLMPNGADADNRQVIKYKLNTDSLITNIEMSEKLYAESEVELNTNKFTAIDLGEMANAEQTPLSYKGIYLVGPETVYFVMPEFEDIDEATHYSIKATQWGLWVYNKDIVAYTSNPGNTYVDALTHVESKEDYNQNQDNNQDIIFVTDIATTIDEEGVERPVINGIQTGAEVSFVLENINVLEGTKKGDLIRTRNNGFGRVGKVFRIFDATNNRMVSGDGVDTGYAGSSSDFRFYNYASLMLVGYVYSVEGNMMGILPKMNAYPVPQYEDFTTLSSVSNVHYYDYTKATSVQRMVITDKDVKLIAESNASYASIASKAANPTRIYAYTKNGTINTIIIIDDQRNN